MSLKNFRTWLNSELDGLTFNLHAESDTVEMKGPEVGSDVRNKLQRRQTRERTATRIRTRERTRIRIRTRERMQGVFYDTNSTKWWIEIILFSYLYYLIKGKNSENFINAKETLNELIIDHLNMKTFEDETALNESMKEVDKKLKIDYLDEAYDNLNDLTSDGTYYLIKGNDKYRMQRPKKMIDLTNGQILHDKNFGNDFVNHIHNLLKDCDKKGIKYFIEKTEVVKHVNYFKIGDKCLNFNKNTEDFSDENKNNFHFFMVDSETGNIDYISGLVKGQEKAKLAALDDCSEINDAYIEKNSSSLLKEFKLVKEIEKKQYDDY